MNNIQPIQTEYNGYRFRSRLEARWAVFLDALNVKYDYEPQGFRLANGQSYLPDFKVRCHGKRGLCNPDTAFDLYIEVKGVLSDRDISKIMMFSKHCPVLVVGNLPPQGHSSDSSAVKAYESIFFNYITIDGDNFAAYPAADADGHFYLWGDDSNYVEQCDIRRVERAYDIARTARFEFGETYSYPLR